MSYSTTAPQTGLIAPPRRRLDGRSILALVLFLAISFAVAAFGSLATISQVDGWYADAALAVEFDGRVEYVDPAYGGRPEDVLFDEKRREDALRAVGVRFLRLVDEDLGPRWAPVEARVRRELTVPGPTERSFRAVPRAAGRLRAVGRAG